MNAPAGVIVSHEAIRAELDQVFAGIDPDPEPVPRERSWDCLAGEAHIVCQHVRIERVQLAGRDHVTCTTCFHAWFEYPIALEPA